MRFLKYFLLAILLSCCLFAQAHLNSPGVNYQGKAGKYNILVNIMPPDLIPGIASVSIYIQNYHNEKVYVQTFFYQSGKKGSVAPEMATPSADAKGWFDCQEWLMTAGTASFKIIITGDQGTGTVNIPVMAVPTAKRHMPMSLAVLLVVLGLLLFGLMITIVNSSVSDGLATPGTKSIKFGRKKIIATSISVFVILVYLCFMFVWCKTDRSTFLTFLYAPIQGQSEVFQTNGHNILRLKVDNNDLKYVHQPFELIVPDHGKLMHLVLVKVNTLDVFAHLHPVRQNAGNFLVNLPPLPAGKYFLYGDIVSWNGFAETVIDTVKIPSNPPVQDSVYYKNIITSPDDAWLQSAPVNLNSQTYAATGVNVCGSPGVSFKATDGTTVIWEHKLNEPVKAKKFISLTFHVFGADGKAAGLKPYMGMVGHALVVKYDGSVYAHLHPIGNFAMASQQLVDTRLQGSANAIMRSPEPERFKDSIDKLIARIDAMTEDQRNAYLMAEMGMGKMNADSGKNKGMKMDMPMADGSKCGTIVQFPYAFPAAGRYRIWMQVKLNGKIITSTFDTTVVD